MQVLNGRLVFGCAINCNWAAGTMNAQAVAGAAAATAAPGMPMAAGSEQHQLFVGNLSSDVDDNTLYRAFSPFKSICEARVVKDTDGSSRCYGFVSFRVQADAEQAMVQMNGEWLGKRAIRVNSARNKVSVRCGLCVRHSLTGCCGRPRRMALAAAAVVAVGWATTGARSRWQRWPHRLSRRIRPCIWVA